MTCNCFEPLPEWTNLPNLYVTCAHERKSPEDHRSLRRPWPGKYSAARSRSRSRLVRLVRWSKRDAQWPIPIPRTVLEGGAHGGEPSLFVRAGSKSSR